MLPPPSDSRAQFEIEARILANLNHPNLVRVTDNFVEQPSGRMYLVMGFVEGEDLQDKLDRLGPLPEVQVTLWMDQVLAAVAYLHTHQPPICHRDIKPANIRVLPDERTAGQTTYTDGATIR